MLLLNDVEEGGREDRGQGGPGGLRCMLHTSTASSSSHGWVLAALVSAECQLNSHSWFHAYRACLQPMT